MLSKTRRTLATATGRYVTSEVACWRMRSSSLGCDARLLRQLPQHCTSEQCCDGSRTTQRRTAARKMSSHSRKTEMSHSQDVMLCELVSQHPCLYDLKNPKYRDTMFRDRIWEEIGAQLKLAETMCESNNSVEAAMHVAPLELSDNRRQQQIEAALCELQFTMETVKKIGRVFESELEKGIHEEPSSLQMENTYIPELPDGTEKGKFLALDLGGTNFRVILLELDGGKVTDEKVKHYHLDDELKVGCGDRLFGFLAECISDFVKEQNLTGARLPLGFTFSFPMIQKALDVGILVTWTKTFNCPSVVGKDAVQMLKDAIHRRGDTHVEVLAVLNDTTGTLVQGAVLDNRTAIGLILGTGSNACYLERADRVQHWEGQRHGEKQVIIDIEWGAFGDNGVLDFIKTDYDREVDKNSLLATSFTFEKYISGKYLGEIVRVILVRLTASGLLFDGIASKKLLSQNSFPTSYVSQIEQDTVDGGNKNTEDILDKFNLQYTTEDIAVVKYVCEVVSNRSALLVSICLSRLLIRMDRPDTTIAVDGSLFKHHPRLKTWMNKYIQLLAPGKKFRLLLAEDGSGKGAGIVAAIALRLKERFQET